MNEPFVHKLFVEKALLLDDSIENSVKDTSLEAESCKKHVDYPVYLTKRGLVNKQPTEQANKEEASLDNALFAYAIGHYKYWKETYQDVSLDIGSMGEHLSLLEMDEFTVCIGDTYRFGDAVIQVSQPNDPYTERHVSNLAKEIAGPMRNSGKTGWCFRVLEEGKVLSKIDLELIERPHPQWTIAACNEVMYFQKDDLRTALEWSKQTLLGKSWRRAFKNRLLGFESLVDEDILKYE